MINVNGTTIELTRGDTLAVEIELKKDGETFVLNDGDSLRFIAKHERLNSIMTEYIDRNPVIEKDISTQTMTLNLSPEDTKNLGFGKYVYDLEITFADRSVETVVNNASLVIVPEVD